VIHHYVVPAREMEDMADLIAGLGRESLGRIESVPRERLDTLPVAALTLARLLRLARPNRVVFSAWALREGVLLSHLGPRERREDPLIAAAKGVAHHPAREASTGEALIRFTAPLFVSETPERVRLREAACHMADLGWRMHPDYRGEQAFFEVLRAPIVGVDHQGRMMLAFVLHARYRGGIRSEATEPYRRLLSGTDLDWARVLGLALRLALTLAGGVPRLLDRVTLSRDAKRLTLALPAKAGVLAGEQVEKRLEALARAIGLAPELKVGG
jgi:exopolyphosphatase/guanosine-5'-triphosphate,3'-diphosphate pyrophosphatase